MDTAPLLSELAQQGERRAWAKAEADTAMTQIRRLAKEAYDAGARKVDIAAAAKISRPALDDILRG